MSQDTIAAIATARGEGSVSIVRISGNEAVAIAERLTKKTFEPRVATLSKIYTGQNEPIDKAIVIYFKAPHSFTTEDVIEFQTHGGNVVVSRLLDEVLTTGARLANPGEFSRRAYLGGRADLLELETTAALINARSEEAAKLLAKQIDGTLKNELSDYREKLLEILAHTEVNIDYAEEDLPPDTLETIETNLAFVQEKLRAIVAATHAREAMFEGYKLSIIGRPNVGKSSLLNRLLLYERAIVSPIEGTTRDTIEESLKIGSHTVRIVDTAGIRDGAEAIERIGIERTLASARGSDIVLALFDSSDALKPEDLHVLDFLREIGDKKIFILLTKCDLPQQIDKNKIPQNFESISVSKESDLNLLNDAILTYLDQNANYEESVLTSKRQLESANKGLSALQNAAALLNEGELELFAFEVNSALDAIKSIGMPSTNEDVLDKVFSTFCLGK